MPRFKRKERRYDRARRPKIIAGHYLKIGGELVNVINAPYIFLCKECHGKIRIRDAGLACLALPSHRGFIKKKEAAEVAKAEAKKQASIEAVYEIVDGIIVPKEQ